MLVAIVASLAVGTTAPPLRMLSVARPLPLIRIKLLSRAIRRRDRGGAGARAAQADVDGELWTAAPASTLNAPTPEPPTTRLPLYRRPEPAPVTVAVPDAVAASPI